MASHTVVVRSVVTFVDAINAKNYVKNNESYFLQTIVFCVLTKLLRKEKEYGAKKFIAYSSTVRSTIPHVCAAAPDILSLEASSQKPL